jgi:hypothetical protein
MDTDISRESDDTDDPLAALIREMDATSERARRALAWMRQQMGDQVGSLRLTEFDAAQYLRAFDARDNGKLTRAERAALAREVLVGWVRTDVPVSGMDVLLKEAVIEGIQWTWGDGPHVIADIRYSPGSSPSAAPTRCVCGWEGDAAGFDHHRYVDEVRRRGRDNA